MSENQTYQFSGIVHDIGDLDHVGNKNTAKRQIVLKDDGRYPQFIPFDFLGRSVEEINKKGIQIGDSITIRFSLQGRYWEKGSRYFPKISGFRITNDSKSCASASPAPNARNQNQQSNDDHDDDVPF